MSSWSQRKSSVGISSKATADNNKKSSDAQSIRKVLGMWVKFTFSTHTVFCLSFINIEESAIAEMYSLSLVFSELVFVSRWIVRSFDMRNDDRRKWKKRTKECQKLSFSIFKSSDCEPYRRQFIKLFLKISTIKLTNRCQRIYIKYRLEDELF